MTHYIIVILNSYLLIPSIIEMWLSLKFLWYFIIQWDPYPIRGLVGVCCIRVGVSSLYKPFHINQWASLSEQITFLNVSIIA